MSKKYSESKEVVCFTLQIEKSHTAFFLHTLESCDNLAFPTTLPFEKGSKLREILVRAPTEQRAELKRWIEHVGRSIPLLRIEERIEIDD